MVKLSFERLYLAKNNKDSKQDIYVDKCPLVQHQLDGIRFLYRAFKKKNRAVILNDPSGYGKRVQTALFVGALLPTLDKPVLILCNEGTEQRWMKYFEEWTQICDDVAIELSNPLVKKKVVVSALYCATAFARREWSVLVVDSDRISRDVQKSSIKADLKIWITSSAIKEDLAKFSVFHSWVYPKEKFLADKYNANTSDLKDVLLKTAMLDAFLEDTVLRRDCGTTPFTTTQVVIPNTERTTKKNKDATGIKIKRSKRKSTDFNNTEGKDIPNKVARPITYKKTAKQNTGVFEIGDLGEANTNKSFVDNVAEAINKDSTQSDEDNFAPSSHNKNKRSLVWDSEDSDDEEENITKLQVDHCKDKKDTELNESGELNALRWDSETCTQNCHKESHMDSNGGQISIMKPLNNDEISIEVHDADNSVSVTKENEIELNKNDLDNEIISTVSPVVQSEDLFSTDLVDNEVNVKVKEIIYETEHIDQPSTNILEDNELKDESVKNDMTKKPVNANLSSFDLKMKEMEELTMKKFKGSFLDKIF